MLRIAIVGTGIIAGLHIDAINKLENCTLVALCDLNKPKLDELCEKFSVPGYTDYKEMSEKEDFDAAILNLPHGLHADASIFFLESGRHVLVEKPMANTLEECDKMLESAKKSGKKLAVGHIQRFFRPNRVVKEYIENGILGKFCMYSEQRSINYFLPDRPAWFTNKKMAGGGIIMNYGAHAFDKLFYVCGKRPISITANTANLINDRDVEGHAQIFAQFEDGLSAVITFSGYSTVVYESYYYFTGGAIKINGVDSAYVLREGEKEWQPIDAKRTYDEFVTQLNEFVKYVNGEESEIADGIYSRDIIEAIEKCYKA